MELQPLKFYLKSASKLTKYFVKDRKIRQKMLCDEDFLGEAAYKLMMADKNWRPEENVQIKTLRCKYFINHCRTFVKKLHKQREYNNMGPELFEAKKYKAAVNTIDVESLTAILPPRERGIIQDYFFNDMTFKEIGGKIGVSKQRVCELLKNALKTLRKKANG